MENDIFEQFDGRINMEALAADIEAAKNGTKKNIPHDTYEVKIVYMGIGATKENPRPMAKVTFEIVYGDYKGSRIYFNQVFDPKSEWCGLHIHRFNEFLRSLKTELPVRFTTFREYNQLLLDIKGECEGYSFQLNYAADKKNPSFNTFTIEDRFQL